jgi:hypothetical protein
VPTPCGGPTPVWRFAPPWRDDCRAAWLSSSATSPGCRSLLPSSAQGWLSLGGSPGRRRGGRGAAHGSRRRPTPSVAAPERVAPHSVGLRARGPRRTAACHAAARLGCTSVLCRRRPGVSRAAPGARALLPAGRRHDSRSPAVGRWRRPSTARASVGARRRRACPWSGLCAHLAHHVGPGSGPRRQRGAAADKAPGRA